MNNKFMYFIVAAVLSVVIAAGYTSCKKDPDKPIVITVGAQSGEMIAGVAGAVTFPVTTDNLVNGSYMVTVATLPSGVSVQGSVAVSADKGTLTLAGDGAQTAGTTSLTMSIGMTASNPFTLTVKEPPFVAVTGITGVPTEAMAGEPLELTATVAPADATNTAIVWSIADAGDTDATITGGNTFNATTAGVATVRATIAGGAAQGAAYTQEFDVTVSVQKTVSVGEQKGTINAGAAGTASFDVTTTGIDAGEYDATVANIPNGVTVQGKVTVDETGDGTLILAGGASTTEGEFNTLTLAIDGATSEPFTLTIAPAIPKTVTVGEQEYTLTEGQERTVRFPVTTTGIANGRFASPTVQNLPTGVTVSGSVTITNGAGRLNLVGSASTVPGVYDNLRLVLDGVTSEPFTLTIDALPFAGSGTYTSPYLINTADELKNMRDLVNDGTEPYANAGVYYRQTANIDLAGDNWTPIGTEANPFRGVYAGGTGVNSAQNFIIENLTVSGSGSGRGLFGYVNHANAVIRLVRLTNVNISGGSMSGGVVGRFDAGTVVNCRVSGTGSISGSSSVGGVAGGVYEGAVVENCYVVGVSIASSGSNSSYAGGIAGSNRGTVKNCYSTSAVTGSVYAAGIVADNRGGSAMVEYCYSTGVITGSASSGAVYAGGIIAYNGNDATVRNCIALNPNVSTPNNTSGSVGRVIATNSLNSPRSNNYARETGMTLVYGSFTYTPTSSTAVHNGNDGESTTQYSNLMWYPNLNNIWFNNVPLDTNNIWEISLVIPLPRLRGFIGDTQNHTLP